MRDLDSVIEARRSVSGFLPDPVPREVIEESVRNAVNFSVFDGQRQVGFARVVTDFSTFMGALIDGRSHEKVVGYIERARNHPDATILALARLGFPLETLAGLARIRPASRTGDEPASALDAIAEVGPGGHHFGTAHTLQRYESAFYAPIISSRDNFERWQEAGSVDAATRANAIWKQLLKDYEQPELDPAIEEALVDYVEQRKQELKS